MKLWIATENENKRKEFTEIFAPFGIEVKTVRDLENFKLPPETGATFRENALIKARALYQQVNQPVLADDSGLCIEALNGAPGVYSARCAGPDATDKDRRHFILNEMQGVNNRNACFISALSYIDKSGEMHNFEGTISGEIDVEERGSNGFGYNAIFYLPELGKTMAEISENQKNAISHRGKAIQQFLSYLQGEKQ